MEKDTPRRIVSLNQYRITQETARTATIAVIQEMATGLVRAAKMRLEQISDDSFVNRMEADETLRFLSGFNRKVARISPGQTVDLRRKIKDYGHDPEAEAADIASGIPHISDADRAEAEYQKYISLVSPLLDF